MSVNITATKPDGGTLTRTFANRREAAKYGVAYYLRDNGYATPREATTAATQYQAQGYAEHAGLTFREGAAMDR